MSKTFNFEQIGNMSKNIKSWNIGGVRLHLPYAEVVAKFRIIEIPLARFRDQF